MLDDGAKTPFFLTLALYCGTIWAFPKNVLTVLGSTHTVMTIPYYERQVGSCWTVLPVGENEFYN